jgi:hypothetical protein
MGLAFDTDDNEDEGSMYKAP